MNGYLFTVERNKLCIWLEEEKGKLAGLPAAERERRTMALEHSFRVKLDALYEQAAPEFAGAKSVH